MTSLLSIFVPLACAGLAFALSPIGVTSPSATTSPIFSQSTSAPLPCTGCVASKDQDLRWLDIPGDCSESEGPLFGSLVISNESLAHGSCWGVIECTAPSGCSWQYDLELVLNNDRPEQCFPDGVWADKTGWPARLNILNYDFGTLTSSAANCDESGPKTGNQVSVAIYAPSTSSTMCAGVIMRVQCSACE